MGLHIQPVKWGKAFFSWGKDVYLWLRLVVRLWTLRHDDTWSAARRAVDAVTANRELQSAAVTEPNISFCPSCGQIPDGDRRMDHARKIAHEILQKQPPRYELDAAIALSYFARKHVSH